MVGVPPILETPEGIAAVTLAVVAVLYWQKSLNWREYRTVHRAKVLLAPLVDAHTPYFVLSEKAYRNKSPEFLATRDEGVRAVWERLCESGSPHLISSVKVREHPEAGRQYSAAHVVWTHSDQTQTEAYLFANPDGTTDVYCHHETSVADADGHLSEGGVAGDPKGVVRDALGMEEP